MKDRFGNDLEVGDEVVFTVNTTYNSRLDKGFVLRFGTVKIIVGNDKGEKIGQANSNQIMLWKRSNTCTYPRCGCDSRSVCNMVNHG